MVVRGEDVALENQGVRGACSGHPQHFTAAIFDLDGTIIASSQLHLQTFNEILSRYGVTIPEESWYDHYEGTGSRHILQTVLARHGLLKTAPVEELRAEREKLFQDRARAQLLPTKGFPLFYEELRRLGTPRMIATNGSEEEVRFILQLLKLEEERFVTAGEAGKLKPDPAVYLLACERLGVPPAKAVIFEDSVPGVVAGKRAGAYLVALLTTTTKERLAAAGADLIVKDFTSLTPALFFQPRRLAKR